MSGFNAIAVLFFIPEGNIQTNGVYVSQVLGLARFCVSMGARCLIVQFNPDDKRTSFSIEPGIDVANDNMKRPYTQFWFYTKVFRDVGKRLGNVIKSFAPTHVYTRQYQACLAARQIADKVGAKLVYSMRGPDEFERRQMGGFKNWVASKYIAFAVKKAMGVCDVFTTMTHSFAEWNRSKFGRDAIVFPCCVADRFLERISEMERTKLRASLGFSDSDKVVVWCGGLFAWQRLPEIVKLGKGLTEIDSSIKFIFIIRDTIAIEKLCLEAGMKEGSWQSVALQPADVPRYLQASDIGIDLLYLDDFKCSICCPVKIPEYLASGLPVLVSRTMGDIPDIVQRYNVGYVMEDALCPSGVIKQIKKAIKLPRERMVSCAQQLFSWEANAKCIESLFAR